MTMHLVSDNTVDQDGNRWVPPRLFAHHTDGQLSFVYVPFRDLERVGLSPHAFSDRSRLDHGGVFLDEVLDLPLFESIHEEQGRFYMVLVEVHEEAPALGSFKSNTKENIRATWDVWKEQRPLQPVD